MLIAGSLLAMKKFQPWTINMLTNREQILPVDPDRIPQVLKDAPQWTVWRAEASTKKAGSLDKVPYRAAAPGRKASSTDASTWTDYETAINAYVHRDETLCDGLMFACGDGIGGVDIDNCIDPQTGEITPAAWEVIRAVNSYAERSISGTGVRIFVRMPEMKALKDRIEIYTSKRFLSVTGQHIEGTPLTVEDRGEELTALREQIEAERAAAKVAKRKRRNAPQREMPADQPPCSVTSLGLTDDEVLAVCRGFRGFEALFNGSIEGCTGQSEADFKLAGMLAFACGPGEHERVERLMRRSGLVRDKWDRDDYLPTLTIHNAYAGRSEFYPWPERDPDAPPPTGDARPAVLLGPETDAILQQLERHLSPHLYQRYGHLVSVAVAEAGSPTEAIRRPAGAVIVSEVSMEQVHRLLSRHVVFERRQTVIRAGKKQRVAKQVPAPANLAKLFTNCGQWPVIPHLAGISTTPFIRADGVVIDTPGHDSASGYLFVSDGTQWLSTPSRPTPGQVQAAIDVLLDIITDFPFETDEHRSAWLASLCTAIARPAIIGPVPMLWIDGSRAGTGKTKLARLIGYAVNGREPAEISFTTHEQELETRLAALLLQGDTFAFFDNAAGSVRNPVLDRFLTATYFGVRKYFTQTLIKPRNTATLAITGNNLVLRGDLCRRVLRVRLVTSLERPESRTGFRHPDIEGFVVGQRPQIVNAVLTILRAHAVAGFPVPPRVSPLGSFGEWERVVRHAIIHAGLPDPVATQQEVRDEDDDASKLLAVLQAWHRFMPSLSGTATRIVEAAMSDALGRSEDQAAFVEALRELTGVPVDRPPCSKTLGYRLRDARDKRLAGYRVVKQNRGSSAGSRWRLEYEEPADSSGNVSPLIGVAQPESSRADGADDRSRRSLLRREV
jgi:hypothetical protein